MKKYISLFLAIVLVFTVCAAMAGCKAKNDNVVNAEITEYLVAEKVGTINRDRFTVAAGGLFYNEDDKYGVMSHEGLFDTGAVFAQCGAMSNYFKVSYKAFNGNDLESVNSYGIINSKGRVLIPSLYAKIEILNDRYAVVYTATERTYAENDENTIIELIDYDSNTTFMYKGTWAVFDMLRDREVLGISGTTTKNHPYAKGNYLTYTNENGDTVKINGDEKLLPEGARLFSDGSYSVEGKVGEVYDTNDQKLFSYDLTGFTPSSVSDDYYIASRYVDGSSKYVVMDKKGNIVSAEFPDYITVYGKLIHCENKVYNFEGTPVIDGEYESVYNDKMFGQSWIIRQDEAYTMIDANGNVFFAGVEDNKHMVFTSDFVAYEKKDEGNFYYSFKDKGYTIQGYSFAPWIVKTSGANYTYNLVDTMTGKTLLEGYSGFDYTARTSLSYYVYAKYNGGAEVYLIVSNAQLSDVSAKKTNLFDDLIAAFAAEGIKVNVNKETGEIALDSSVLFGGDSAVLTADGKTFLNKFIKVYTNIAFSDKYEGFITKTIVEGHTAPVSGSTYASGLPLSEERANNVRDYCLSSETGVDVSKIANSLEAVGYSNSKPVYDANGNVDMAASRRVSFRFLVAVDI